MAQWFFSYDGERSGPFDDAAARDQARRNPDGHCWRDGFGAWQRIADVGELGATGVGVPPTPPPATSGASDEVDYRIFGTDMQFVEIELDPGESAVAEAGALMYKDAAVNMDTVFGDGSHSGQGGGIKSMFFGGEGMFLASLTGPGKVWLQSLPFSRMAGRMLAAAPQGGGERRGEGSILGGLGDLIGGDRNF